MKLTAKDIEDRDLVCCYCGKRDGITEACDNGDDNIFAIHCNDYATLIPRSVWDDEITDDLSDGTAPRLLPDGSLTTEHNDDCEMLAEGPCSCGGPYGGDHMNFCCIWQS